MITEDLVLLNTADNEKIAVWKVLDRKKSNNKNIFLTHGAFSNKMVCLGISKYLAEFGYTCYIMEWRNHGDSIRTNKNFNFETIAVYDLKTVFTYLFDQLNIPTLDCITHSGGGISLTMFLIRYKIYNIRITSITMFACQAFGAAISIANKSKILLSKYLTSMIGFVPAKMSKLGPQDESYFTMKQWFNWNLKTDFRSTDGKFDYKTYMTNVKPPIYSISAKGDTFISPSRGCRMFLESFDKPNNILTEFSIENGNLEDYNHSRIIMSRNAAAEIWPTVLNWIKRNEKH